MDITREEYLKLIDIVAGEETASPLVTFLAKRYPQVLLEFHGVGDCAKYLVVVCHMKARQRVHAIKELRAIEGIGLKQAMNCVDFASQEVSPHCVLPTEDELEQQNVLGIAKLLRTTYNRGY